MKLAIVGTGLIGGSFAKGARRRGLFSEIVGLDADPQCAARALQLGLIDRVVDVVPADARALLLAAPAEAVGRWVCQLADHAGLMFDAASVKGPVIEAVLAQRPRLPPRFVPCHPIAGSERSGPEAADAELFAGRPVILTPVAETDRTAVDEVGALWRGLGARIERMAADVHDEVLAVTSHLPHLLAFAYLDPIEPEHLAQAGSGFEDFTRIGGADAKLWAQIFCLNRAPLLAALAGFKGALGRLESALASGRVDELAAMIASASAKRRNLGRG